ncbi:dynein regulatory complex subunit 3-like isoform X2 [Halichondria panicea]|uniref:dynein regulatory complex subunit 3-like isoform X2 n=1 Tax=Halichondria panicea TaxID=6063 RepID=UPI00312BC270
MSRLYDTIEPDVISEALIHKCVLEQGPDGEAGRIAKEEGIDFKEVTQLRLDFQNILRIENLWQFTSLRKLQLDNNIIEDVTGLDSLVHLEWLDLSFNNIEIIGGLDELVNLRDLSLAHNRITQLENLDTLVNLQVLSLANNLLEDVDCVRYLRQFKRLQTLCIKGNPVVSSDNFHSFTISFIPSLVYLDFRMIMEEEREEAVHTFRDELREIELTERELKRNEESRRLAEEKAQLYKSAYVDGLEDTTLYLKMFEEDSDSEQIKHLPELPEMLQQYETDFVACCNHLVKVGLEEREKRLIEVEDFRTTHKRASEANQQASVERVKAFEQLKAQLVPGGRGKSALKELETAIESLDHDLMRLEMQLVEQLDDLIKDFELKYSNDIVGPFKEQVQSHMTQLRDLENNHHEKVTEIGTTMLEKFVKNQLDEEPHEDLRVLFMDKDTLVSALNNAHDTHMLIIDGREDAIAQQMSRDMTSLTQDIQDGEIKRNRQKVVEIERYIDSQREEIEALEMSTPTNPS